MPLNRRSLIKLLAVTPAISQYPEIYLEVKDEFVPILIRVKVLDKSNAEIKNYTLEDIVGSNTAWLELELADEVWRHKTKEIVRLVYG